MLGKLRYLFTLIVLVGLGLLTSCTTFSDIHRGDSMLSATNFPTGNCAITSFDAPGQGLRMAGSGLRMAGSGLRMAGSVGGLFISDTSIPFPTVSPQEVSSYLSPFSDKVTPDTAIGIVVLDQFRHNGTAAYTLGNNVEDLVFAAQKGQASLNKTFENLKRSGEISHGALVLSHLNSMLGSLEDASFVSQPRDDTFIFSFRGQTMVVKAVDIAGMNTDAMVPALDNALTTLDYDYGITKVAVNMSFALVPCRVLQAAQDQGFSSLDEYLEALAATGELGTMDEILGSFGDEIDPVSDSFIIRLNDYDENLAYIASAGNFARDYPMYPALADNVLSVSSHDFDSGLLSNFTNYGEVSAPGELFNIDDTVTGISNSYIAYAGTSFSSPEMTLFAALDLSQKIPGCFEHSPNDLLKPGVYNNPQLEKAIGAC